MKQFPDPKHGKYTGDQRITAAEYSLLNMAESLNQGGKVRKIVDKLKSLLKDKDI